MIGSKRKIRMVYQNLKEKGISEELLGKVHAPIGVDIGAETPDEIAVSILAELIQVRAGRK
jgi:xanthine dehydrogenase accessory factor